MRFLNRKKVLFIIVFAALALVADRINFSSVLGAPNQFFTLFQFFAPVAGAFLGTTFGVAAVLIAEAANFFLLGKTWTILNVLRLAPMLLATYFFAKYADKKDVLSFAVPIAAIAAFALHPVGRQAWMYSLWWTIPLIAKLAPRNLFLRSLGATFTAHAVGSIVWLYMIPMTPQQWMALIPVVAYERLVFATGIVASFLAFNAAISFLSSKSKLVEENLLTERQYLWKRAFA